MINNMNGAQYVQGLAQKWTSVQWSIIDNYGPEEAKDYLSQGNGRLAVIPSRIENSPYTVIECAERQIPFIASRVGGIVDLIHREDHDKVLFNPEVDALVAKVASIVQYGASIARPNIDAFENEKHWLS